MHNNSNAKVGAGVRDTEQSLPMNLSAVGMWSFERVLQWMVPAASPPPWWAQRGPGRARQHSCKRGEGADMVVREAQNLRGSSVIS